MNATSNQIEIVVDINGRSRTDLVPVRMHAADYLRHKCGLTGTHVGCEQGICGMCTVEVDGAVVKSCLILAAQLDGKSVRTVETLASDEGLSPLQEAFKRHHALQCGYCTPGFLMVAQALEQRGKALTRDQIREEINGVLCRCTGYEGIISAIEEHLSTQARLRDAVGGGHEYP